MDAQLLPPKQGIQITKDVRRYKVQRDEGWHLFTGHAPLAPAGAVELTAEEIAEIDDPSRVWCFDSAGVVSDPPAPTPTPELVRDEARRRILAAYSIEDQLNTLMGADPAAVIEMRAAINQIRSASRALSDADAIPADFADAKYWKASE